MRVVGVDCVLVGVERAGRARVSTRLAPAGARVRRRPCLISGMPLLPPLFCIGFGLVWAGICNPHHFAPHRRLLPPPLHRRLQSLHDNHEDWLRDACTLAVTLKQRLEQQQHATTTPASSSSASCSTSSPQQIQIQSLEAAPPAALALVDIPPSIANHLYIIDSTKVPGEAGVGGGGGFVNISPH